MILTNLSGGIDSANCVYNVLKTGQKIRVHHCKFQTFERRCEVEYQASQNIIDWFKTQGCRKVDYLESSIDLTKTRYSFYDIELFGFLAGGCLRSLKGNGQNTFMLSTSKDDFEQPDFHIRHNDRLELIKMMSKDPNLEIIIPNQYKSRKEVIQEMPVELVKLCWFCRRPDKDSKPCRKCKTCLQTFPIFEELGIE